MKIRTLQAAAIVTAVSIVVSGCENMTPGQNAAVFGVAGGAAAGGIARGAGMSTGGAVLTGLAAGAAIAAVTYIIAKHQATERQRRIAQERAARAYAAHQARIKQHKARYIAVDTEKDQKSSANAKKSVMIWDTQSQQVVGNEVYDVKSPPPVGSTAKFEGYQAEYVGSGT